jgi:hypothetical protein
MASRDHQEVFMDMIIKVPMFILLGLIILSLGQAMFYLGRDDGDVDRTRMVRALTVRITLSLILFGLLMAGYYFGMVQPHSG